MQKNKLAKRAKNNTYGSKIKMSTLYCLRQVDSCLHCKFRNGAWRPRAAFQDSEFPNEDRIIDIDYSTIVANINSFVLTEKIPMCVCTRWCDYSTCKTGMRLLST